MSGPRRFAAGADGGLDDAMRGAYAEDGFLVLDGFFSRADCEALLVRMRQLIADYRPPADAPVFSTTDPRHADDRYFRESGDKIRFFLEDAAGGPDGRRRRDMAGAINKIGHALHDLDPVFAAFSRRPRLARLAGDLGLRAPLLLQSMLILKPPRIGGEVVWHQDATFLYTEPVSVVGLWLALQPARPGNGGLQALPGGHREGLKARFRERGGRLVTEVLDAAPFSAGPPLDLPAEPGTLIVLHGLLPHRSDANRSPDARAAYALHLIDGTARYAADNWLRRAPSLPLRGFA